VLFLATVGYFYIIPYQCKSLYSRTLAYVFLTVGLINLIARYVYAVGTNPGTPNSAVYARLKRSRDNEKPEERIKQPSLLAWTKCRHTGIPKPPRAHFDSVNKQLIINFDHWCPWLFNSVGYGNYRHFVVFIGWVWALTSVGAILTAEAFLEGLKRPRRQAPEYSEIASTIVFCVCLALGVAVGVLFGWHLYLVLSNQTSVDFLVLAGRRTRVDPDYPNVFDRGSVKSNLYQVLFSEGGGWWELFLPPPPFWRPLGEPYPDAFAWEERPLTQFPGDDTKQPPNSVE
jgi:hypothetical protein